MSFRAGDIVEIVPPDKFVSDRDAAHIAHNMLWKNCGGKRYVVEDVGIYYVVVSGMMLLPKHHIRKACVWG